MKNLLVFASGSKDSGGSGFQKLVENSRTGILEAKIVGVVSNHQNGGERQKAENLNIPFKYFENSDTCLQYYRIIVQKYRADFIVLSGWLKKVTGLDPRKTINIHPGPLPKFGGPGKYGHKVHEAVITAFKNGEITTSAVSMHFVTEECDRGPLFFELPVLIDKHDTPETLAKKVNELEHRYQSWVVNLIVNGEICWDGKNPQSLQTPPWYPFRPIRR